MNALDEVTSLSGREVDRSRIRGALKVSSSLSVAIPTSPIAESVVAETLYS